jgi:hypothetical protein
MGDNTQVVVYRKPSDPGRVGIYTSDGEHAAQVVWLDYAGACELVSELEAMFTGNEPEFPCTECACLDAERRRCANTQRVIAEGKVSLAKPTDGCTYIKYREAPKGADLCGLT